MRFYIGRWERYLADAELARIDAIEEQEIRLERMKFDRGPI